MTEPALTGKGMRSLPQRKPFHFARTLQAERFFGERGRQTRERFAWQLWEARKKANQRTARVSLHRQSICSEGRCLVRASVLESHGIQTLILSSETILTSRRRRKADDFMNLAADSSPEDGTDPEDFHSKPWNAPRRRPVAKAQQIVSAGTRGTSRGARRLRRWFATSGDGSGGTSGSAYRAAAGVARRSGGCWPCCNRGSSRAGRRLPTGGSGERNQPLRTRLSWCLK